MNRVDAPNRTSAIILTVARAARKANVRLYQADRGLMYSTFVPEAVATRTIRTETLGKSAPAVGDTSGLAAPFLGGIAWSSEGVDHVFRLRW